MVEMPQDRNALLRNAIGFVRDGMFEEQMRQRISLRTISPHHGCREAMERYFTTCMKPMLEEMGFELRLLENPRGSDWPALFAERIEHEDLPTILIYGHADVLDGMDDQWSQGRSPWELTRTSDRFYGRGMADNKGQHTINLAALRLVLEARGHLGFNVKILLESAEEVGSIGLADIAKRNAALLKADCLIASDGPRMAPQTPTVFLGCRGTVGFELNCAPRADAYHSGNWGGLLSNPAIRLSQALATITDAKGKILIPDWRPQEIEPSVQKALDDLERVTNPGDPEIDATWGEPGRTGAAQVLGWCNFEVLAMVAGNPEAPVTAIPPMARATCHLRFTPEIDAQRVIPALRAHLDAAGFSDISITPVEEDFYRATRTDPMDSWVQSVVASLTRTLGRAPALQPNFGGSLPNEVFAETLDMPTVWIPHSHPACGQHAPDEHMLISIAEEGMQIMSGLFWDLAEANLPRKQCKAEELPA